MLVEEEKTEKNFLEGLFKLHERVSAIRKFGFCRRCDQELPDIEMYCAHCVVSSVLDAKGAD